MITTNNDSDSYDTTIFHISGAVAVELPWGSCNNYWNTKNCVNPYDRSSLICWNEIFARNGSVVKMCTVNNVNVTVTDLTDPVKEFWESV